jgi:hypothetical protein
MAACIFKGNLLAEPYFNAIRRNMLSVGSHIIRVRRRDGLNGIIPPEKSMPVAIFIWVKRTVYTLGGGKPVSLGLNIISGMENMKDGLKSGMLLENPLKKCIMKKDKKSTGVVGGRMGNSI